VLAVIDPVAAANYQLLGESDLLTYGLIALTVLYIGIASVVVLRIGYEMTIEKAAARKKRAKKKNGK